MDASNIRRHYQSLTPRERYEAIQAMLSQGMNDEQVAQLLGIPEAQVTQARLNGPQNVHTHSFDRRDPDYCERPSSRSGSGS